MVKLVREEGIMHACMDTWSSIRSNIDYNNLCFSTRDKKLILFNREIFCFLSPLLSRLIKGTFESSCCLVNSVATFILPDFSSKTFYDLHALMVEGTVTGLSADDAKELKSLHSFLGLESLILKDENEDEITVVHESRHEDDTTDGDGGDYEGDGGDYEGDGADYEGDGADYEGDGGENEGDGGDNEGEGADKDGQSQIETRGNNDEEETMAEDYTNFKQNCYVKLEKLKKDDNDCESNKMKTKLRKKRLNINQEKSDSDDSDVSFHVKNVRPAKKRKRSGRSNSVNYKETANSDAHSSASEPHEMTPHHDNMSHGTAPRHYNMSHGTVPYHDNMSHGTAPYDDNMSHGTAPRHYNMSPYHDNMSHGTGYEHEGYKEGEYYQDDVMGQEGKQDNRDGDFGRMSVQMEKKACIYCGKVFSTMSNMYKHVKQSCRSNPANQ